MELSRQECWSGLPFPSPGDLPDPAIKPGPPELQVESLSSEPPRRLSNRNSNKTAQDGWLGQPLAVPLTRSSGDNGQKKKPRRQQSAPSHLPTAQPAPVPTRAVLSTAIPKLRVHCEASASSHHLSQLLSLINPTPSTGSRIQSQSFVCTVKPLPALTTCPSYSASSTPPLPREAESNPKASCAL